MDLLRTLLDGCPAVATDQLTQSVYSDPALITALNTSANEPKINHQVSNSFVGLVDNNMDALDFVELIAEFFNYSLIFEITCWLINFELSHEFGKYCVSNIVVHQFPCESF